MKLLYIITNIKTPIHWEHKRKRKKDQILQMRTAKQIAFMGQWVLTGKRLKGPLLF